MNKFKRTNGSEIGRSVEPFRVTAFQKVSTTYNIFLQGAIESEEDFNEALTVLSIAEEQDSVNIYLSSPGGSVDAANTLVYAMSKCQCPVHVLASGTVASAAPIILLSADSFEIDNFAQIMFHQWSYGSCANVTDMFKYAEFTKKQMRKHFEFHTKGFFTQEEIDDILENKNEYWMDADEFVERFQNMQEYRTEEVKKQLVDTEDEESFCDERCADCTCDNPAPLKYPELPLTAIPAKTL